MATVALPSSLRGKLIGLSRRLQRLRAIRSMAQLAIVLVVFAVAAMLLDSAIQLPRLVRLAALATWSVVAIGGLLRLLVRGSYRPEIDALAARVEEEYPNLAERLVSTVELTEAGDAAHGSPALIDLLTRETEIRASKLNFLQAAPEKNVMGWSVVAAVLALAMALPVALWPDPVANQARRFFTPWLRPAVAYEVIANPGDTAVARGQAVTLFAYVRATKDGVSLPQKAVLVLTEANGATRKLGMETDEPHVFACRLASITEDVVYHVEAGDAASQQFRVSAVEPVALIDNTPAISVEPPAYARKVVEPQVVHGMTDFAVLQYSTLAIDLKFNRRPVVAELHVQSDGLPPVVYPITVADDGLSGRVALNTKANARLQLVLEAEHGIRTNLPAQPMQVTVDRPPAFKKVTGTSDQLRTVNPYETVPIEVELIDDFGVAGAEVEFTLTGKETDIQREPIPLNGQGSPAAVGALAMKLAGKVKEGDSFRYRIRAVDIRNVPEADLGPNVIYYPADKRWLVLEISRNADPIRQQEVLAQRDDLNKRLDALMDDLKAERRRLYRTQANARRQDDLTAEPRFQLKELRKEHSVNERNVGDLARDASLSPAMRPLSDQLQDVADNQMKVASGELEQAEKDKRADVRDRTFQKADRELEEALKRLDQLKKENEKLAQARLDEMKLQGLAERQDDLAKQANKAENPDEIRRLENEQKAVKDELNRLTDKSEALRQAMDAARNDDNRKFADQARDLAQAQRDLAQSARETMDQTLKQRFADLAKKQQELAKKAAELADETRAPARAAQSRPLEPDAAKKAADLLEKGDAELALLRQEQALQELERVGNELDRAVNLAKDPREAARQLARLQEDLKNRFSDAARQNTNKPIPAEQLDALNREQQAIRAAIEKMPVPDNNSNAQWERRTASERAALAAEAIKKQDRNAAEAQMMLAKQALERLAERLPGLDQRLQQARNEVAKMRRQQDDISRQADALMRNAGDKNASAQRELAKKLDDAARKQADLANQLRQLDAPRHEDRLDRGQDALARAMEDLKAGRLTDVPASQAEARRELERLEQALAGQKPADEMAADLAKRQRELANEAARLAKDPKAPAEKGRDLQSRQREIAKDLRNLNAPDAPQRHAEAMDAARAAEQGMREPLADAANKANEAAKALEKLADQMNGRENAAERADRLAKRQAAAADEAKRKDAKPDAASQMETKRRAQQILDEAKHLRAGDAAKDEKQKALDTLSRLNKNPSPDDQKKAADALRDLANKLAKDDANKPAPPNAQDLAREQRQLAKQTSAAANNPEAMKNLANQQRQLADQAKRLPANVPQQDRAAARAAMEQAEQALARNDAATAEKKQGEAAGALERMAAQANAPRPPNQPNAPGMPNADQVQQARQLAKEQRDLRDEVQKAAGALAKNNDAKPRENPAGELAKEQKAIAERAEELARNLAQNQGQQAPPSQQARAAADAARQAANQMQSGALPQARTAGQQAAQAMQRMAQSVPPETASQAQNLAQRQEELNRKMEPLANSLEAQLNQQVARQQELARQAADLANQMQQNAQTAPNNPSNNAMKQAAEAVKLASQQMQKAGADCESCRSGPAGKSMNDAAGSLDRAAQSIGSPGDMNRMANAPAMRRAGESLKNAKQEMAKAQGQLSQGQPQGAAPAMQDAASAIRDAAGQMSPQSGGTPTPNPTSPNTGITQGGGAPDLSKFGPDMKKYAGKSWGELPGELKTRIIQDMKAQYGDDYGRMIKLYFEQLAERK